MTHQSLTPARRQSLPLTTVALTVLTVALWGGTPTAVKYSQDLLPSMAIAAIRFGLAAVFMLFWCWWEGTGICLRRGQLTPSLITGLLLFVQIGLFNWAIELSSASHSSLFINTFIFWVVAIEHFVLRTSRLTWVKTGGLVLAAGGVALILLTTGQTPAEASLALDEPSVPGDLLMLSCALMLGIKIIYTKHATKTVDPGKLIFWHDCVGVVLFAAWSAAFEQPDLRRLFGPAAVTDATTRAAWLGLLYQGVVVAGFCFAVQARLLKRHVASQISVFSFATPLFGMTVAILLRGDRLSPWLLVSAVCVAAGIALVNLRTVNTASHHVRIARKNAEDVLDPQGPANQ